MCLQQYENQFVMNMKMKSVMSWLWRYVVTVALLFFWRVGIDWLCGDDPLEHFNLRGVIFAVIVVLILRGIDALEKRRGRPEA